MVASGHYEGDPVAIDAYDSVLRSIDQPASRSSSFPCLRELFRTHVSDVDLRVMSHGDRAHHLEEMSTLLAIFAASALARTFGPRRWRVSVMASRLLQRI
jgi:hypothetical protein